MFYWIEIYETCDHKHTNAMVLSLKNAIKKKTHIFRIAHELCYDRRWEMKAFHWMSEKSIWRNEIVHHWKSSFPVCLEMHIYEIFIFIVNYWNSHKICAWFHNKNICCWTNYAARPCTFSVTHSSTKKKKTPTKAMNTIDTQNILYVFMLLYILVHFRLYVKITICDRFAC